MRTVSPADCNSPWATGAPAHAHSHTPTHTRPLTLSLSHAHIYRRKRPRRYASLWAIARRPATYINIHDSMDDLPMIHRSSGAALLCVPRPSAEEDSWCGAAEGAQRITAVAAAEGHWLHEATAGAEEWRRLAWCAAQGEGD